MTTRGLQLLLLHHLEKGVTNTENHTNQIGSGIGLFIQADCLCPPPPFLSSRVPPPHPPPFLPCQGSEHLAICKCGKNHLKTQ